jgi:peptidylprolyl isomerase
MIRAAKQDTVKVHYTGRLNDGTVFDRSTDDRPLHFILGRQEVIAGFEDAVDGMYQGESKTVTIPCEKAYGISKPELLEQVDRRIIGKDVELQIGGQLEITNHDGSILHVMVRELTADLVTLDANHPLADKDLTFEIKLLEVKKGQSK